ncbi:porin [Paraburkholderia aspalathi]|uniref:Outer membrane protein (Porin) n=1 Tax=Paraburkholderia aspalathi TaxID=1324617 RepID=A0A1I7ES97_9BURK|nr:porin [Paraburkholderia aspalathi]SFU26794.1 Outer membrane protein (porin) [Paraburkholderia aspalathi]
MKKSFGVIVAIGAFANAANAQSSVTLYGIIDESFEAVSNVKTAPGQGKALYQLDATSGLQGSRWGLRGAEDLGGRLKAIFVLENGFEINTGKLNQGGAEFGRQAFVGLSSTVYGSVTWGRQYDSMVDLVAPFGAAEQWASHRGAHPGDIDNLNNSVRTNNSIKYTSVNYGGLIFDGLYSFGGQPGSNSRNQIFSLAAAYTNGSVAFGVGYLNVRNPNISFFGDNPSGGGVTVNNMAASTNPVFSGYASAHTYQVIATGGSYTFGSATVGATYSNIKFMNLGDTATSGPNPLGYAGTATFNNAEVSGKYQLTPALLLGVAYDYMRGSGVSSTLATVHDSGARYHQFALGADYSLSQRTDVYILGVYQKATGVDSTGQVAVASITSVTAAAGNHAALVRLGVRVKF